MPGGDGKLDRALQEIEALKKEVSRLKKLTPTKWYKIEIETKRFGKGGTDGDVYFWFGGTNNRLFWWLLDSPGDSHEQGDTDVYFMPFYDLGTVNDWNIVIGSDQSSDQWTYELWLYELDESSSRWGEAYHIPTRDSYTTKDPYIPSPWVPSGGCHHDADGSPPQTAGTGPEGIDMTEISHAKAAKR